MGGIYYIIVTSGIVYQTDICRKSVGIHQNLAKPNTLRFGHVQNTEQNILSLWCRI